MRYYAAPMEGVTSYLYRKAHSRYFKKADKYFMPFLSPSHDHISQKKICGRLRRSTTRG